MSANSILAAVFAALVTGTQPQLSAGRIRAIATGHPKRLRSMPDLPAMAEPVPGFSNDGWYGMFAPRGIPAPSSTNSRRT
ncbi:MAG TPA: tripartite tricarboxylate transporter substrate-binding protein [Burkholderiales bacterium]|nr:tripartite tricarboxylate transporter substrate-binding protein [Burkholderiales bacterium]